MTWTWINAEIERAPWLKTGEKVSIRMMSGTFIFTFLK
jgi:hypothetical protein